MFSRKFNADYVFYQHNDNMLSNCVKYVWKVANIIKTLLTTYEAQETTYY